jgi:AsmA protein
MSRQLAQLLSLAAAVLLALAAAALLVARLDQTGLTRRLELRLSAASGLEVRALGATRLHLLPRPRLLFADVVVRDGETEVLRVPRVTAALEWLPLLRRQLRVPNLILEKPVLTVRRGADGRIIPRRPAWGRKAETGAPEGRLPVAKVTVEGGTLRIDDRITDSVAVLEGLDWELGNLHRGTDGRPAFAGELRAERLRVNRIELRQLRGTFSAQDGVYRAAPIRGMLYVSEASFNLQADLSGAHPSWRLELAAGRLSLAELFRALAGRPLYEGNVDVRLDLRAAGSGRLVEHLDGTVDVTGSGLTQHGFDLDGTVRSLRASHRVDLVDVGAYLFAGPVGTLLSRSFDLAGVYRELREEKSQPIDRAAFHWTIENGIARAKDVALRTRENRVAVRGAIDLVRRRYAGITLAVLDRRGCAELTEEISGPLTRPTVRPASLLRTLAGPLAGMIETTREIAEPGACRPFYRGEVAHPPSP